MTERIHKCDYHCWCGIHGVPLIYSPSQNEHVCPNPDCRYAYGVETVMIEEAIETQRKMIAENQKRRLRLRVDNAE